MMRELFIACLFFSGLLLCGGCKEKGVSAEDPFAYYEPDPDIYGKPPDPANVTTDASGVYYAVNQAIVMMEEGSSREEVEQIAYAMGGDIIGQIPPLNIYQIEIPVDDMNELKSTIENILLEPKVEAASPNIGMEVEGNSLCPPKNDNNENIEGFQRCFYSDVEYYPFLTVFEHLRPYLTLGDVNVAVIDTGLEIASGEFQQTPVLNLIDKNAPLTDPYKVPHGTFVSGIIAADDNGIRTNGLASRFLQDRLLLMVGGGEWIAKEGLLEDPPLWLNDVIRSAMNSTLAGADIVNLSISVPVGAFGGFFFVSIRDLWEKLFSSTPNVLYVVSSPNRKKLPLDLDYYNGPPAGSLAPNVITVGGTARCRPDRLSVEHSGRGPLIDIVAPAEDVTVVKVRNVDDVRKGGSSYATPQVTSLAAILKSLDPGISPALIKDYLTTNAFPAYDEQGRGYPRLNFYMPVAQLLFDLNPGREILDVLADQGYPDTYQPNVGVLVYRLCGGLHYSVEGYGNHIYTESEMTEESIVGTINSDSFSISAAAWDAHLSLACNECAFETEKTFPISRDGTNIPGAVSLYYYYLPGSEKGGAVGFGIDGEMTVRSCRIIERNPMTQNPFQVMVRGDFQGVIEVGDIYSEEEGMTESGVHGVFDILMTNLAYSENDPLHGYIEEVCEKEG